LATKMLIPLGAGDGTRILGSIGIESASGKPPRPSLPLITAEKKKRRKAALPVLVEARPYSVKGDRITSGFDPWTLDVAV